MLNIIRTTPSRIKYCGRTVDNLIASNDGQDHKIIISVSSNTPNQNGVEILKTGIRLSEGKPFVFLEDDLNFIAGFNQATEDFARDCNGARSLILPLCAAYMGVLRCPGIAWKYPVKDFYGTQAFIIQPQVAEAFLKYLEGSTLPHKCFDLLLQRWALELGETHFLTPYRAFVQHLGVESSLHNGKFHYYPSWTGTDWRYRSSVFSLEEQINRPCDKELTAGIAGFFGTDLPAYDFGASVGLYVHELRGLGLTAKGYDATPGIAGELVEEVDLARPQTFDATAGNVMCLEVAEHIHQEDEKHLLANIASLCSGKLVASWAVPGQGGKRHGNERGSDYVIKAICDYGFVLDAAATEQLRAAASISWFKQSIYAFTREVKTLAKLP